LSPEEGDGDDLVINRAMLTNSLSPLRGSANLTNQYPRFAKPHLGLNSDRCSAARWRFTSKSSGRDRIDTTVPDPRGPTP